MARGKSLKMLASDIAEGYIAVNPIFLKPFDADSLKGLYEEVEKYQKEVRAQKFPHADQTAIRTRNMKLQRLYSATIIIRNFARERRMRVF